jgi:hypothetical protein
MVATPITVNYEPDGDDWTIEVSGAGETRSAQAPGLIAARDTADQLVAEVGGDGEGTDAVTVVHLLQGDALAFTSAYMHARLGTASETSRRAAGEGVVPRPPQPGDSSATGES